MDIINNTMQMALTIKSNNLLVHNKPMPTVVTVIIRDSLGRSSGTKYTFPTSPSVSQGCQPLCNPNSTRIMGSSWA